MKIHPQAGGESSILLLDIIKILDHHKIPYAIVGAFAASFYGQVRASLDADAVISIDRKEPLFDDFLNSLKKQKAKVTVRQGDPSDPIRCVINIEDSFKNRVYLLIGIKGISEDVYSRTVSASFMNHKVRMIGIEDFIAMKLYAGNAIDIQDAIGVLKFSGKKINFPLLRQLTERYGKKELTHLNKILKDMDHA